MTAMVTVLAGDWLQGPHASYSMTAMVTVVTVVAGDWLQGPHVYDPYDS